VVDLPTRRLGSVHAVHCAARPGPTGRAAHQSGTPRRPPVRYGVAGEQVLGQLVRLAREQRTTVVLVTHDARVAGYADREVTLRDGVVDPTGLGIAAVRR
jgi:hypothetical protein